MRGRDREKEEWKERERMYDGQGTDRKQPKPARDVKQQRNMIMWRMRATDAVHSSKSDM